MSARPFRHLCPEADLRDAMTDEEFWEHVATNLATWFESDEPDVDVVQLNATPCAECGEVGACAYDFEGRALIHATTEADE